MQGVTPVAAFAYPTEPHVRRHGPFGYSDYQPYRDWLRDEFSYRCVFCLRREQWERADTTFHIDHFVPQAVDPSLRGEYDNLLYVCARCNAKKSDLSVPDPAVVAYGECLSVHSDGRITALNVNGELLIDILHLDDPQLTDWRRLFLETLQILFQGGSKETYVGWMRYPESLPDLANKRVKNRRPEGISQCAFERRKRGELPTTY